MSYIRHEDGTRDRRYTIQRECCGFATPRWVARFAGAWVGQAATQMGAVEIARQHQEGRLAVLAGEAS